MVELSKVENPPIVPTNHPINRKNNRAGIPTLFEILLAKILTSKSNAAIRQMTSVGGINSLVRTKQHHIFAVTLPITLKL